MDKEQVVLEAKKLLPVSILYGTITLEDGEYIVKNFMNRFPNSLKDGVTPEKLIEYMEKNFYKYITPNNKARFIEDFVNSIEDFQYKIEIADGEYLDVLSYLYENVLPYMNDENTALIAGKEKSLIEIYNTLLNNRYTKPTIVDFAEICESMCENIPSFVLKSDYNGMTFEEYVMNVIPTMMINVSEVKISGENFDLIDYVTALVIKQKRKEEEKNEKINRTSENPSLVTEIKYALNEEKILEEDYENILTHSLTLEKNELLVSTKLNIIYDIVRVSKDEAMLNGLLIRLNSLKELCNDQEKEFIFVITNEIETKRRNIIKINNNQSDLIMSSLNHIEFIKSKINAATTLVSGSAIFGIITVFENRLSELGIEDPTLTERIAELKEYYRFKMQTMRDAKGEYKNINADNVDIERELEVIKNTVLYLDEADDLFFDSLVRSLNYKLDDLYGKIKASATSNSISFADQEKYLAMRSEIIKELEEKNNKVGKVI